MKARCIKKYPKYLHEDDQYTACSSCKTQCEKAIKCVGCKTVKGVFYKGRRYDLFLCAECYHKEESRRSNTTTLSYLQKE